MGGCARQGVRAGKDLMPRALRPNQLNARTCRWGGGQGWKNQAGGDDERLGAGPERVLDIGMNNLGSILEENISVQS